MPGVKLVTFDLDNTLWAVDEVIHRAEGALLAFLRERYAELMGRSGALELRRARSRLLERRPEYAHNLTLLRRDSIREFLLSLKLGERQASAAADEAFEVFYEARNQVSLFEGARDALRALAERFVLGALTNGNADLQRIGLGEFFAFQYSAESTGRRKPAPDMFQRALRHVNLAAGSAIHVGDHPIEDVRAAREVGMGAVWANPLGALWPEGEAHPEHSFALFDELVALSNTWE